MKRIHIILSIAFLLAVSITLAACNKEPVGDNFVTDANGVAVTDAEGNTAYYAVTNAEGEDVTDADGNKIGALVTNEQGEPYTKKDGKFVYSAVTKPVVTEENGTTEIVTKNDGSPVYEVVTKEDGDILYTTVVNDEGETIFADGTYVNGENNIVTTTKKDTSSEKTDDSNNSSDKVTNKTTTKKDDSPSRTTRTTTKRTETTHDNKTTVSSSSSTNLSYIKTFGGTGNDNFADVVATSDGGYVAIAMGNSANGDFSGSDSNGNTSKFGYVVKYNANGSRVWKTPIGGNEGVELYRATVLKDGSIVVVGATQSSNLGADPIGKLDNLIIKLSASGKIQFTKLVGGKDHEYLKSVAATPDGGFVVGGKTISTDGAFSGIVESTGASFVIKYNASGSEVWKKAFGGNKSDLIIDMSVASNGDIFALCQTFSSTGYFKNLAGNGNMDCVVIKLNKNGNVLWNKGYSSSGTDDFDAITATSDGGCVVGGTYSIKSAPDGVFKDFHNAGGFDSVLVKFNSSGSVSWAKTLAGFEDDKIIAVEKYGSGYLAVGISESGNRDFSDIKNMGEYDVFIWYVDASGNTKSLSSFGGSDRDIVNGLTILSDGKSFVISGSTKSNDNDLKGISPSGSSSASIAFVAKHTI